jgi:hypothetical protein
MVQTSLRSLPIFWKFVQLGLRWHSLHWSGFVRNYRSLDTLHLIEEGGGREWGGLCRPHTVTMTMIILQPPGPLLIFHHN